MWRYMAMQMIRAILRGRTGTTRRSRSKGLRGANDLLIVAGSAPLQMQKNFPTAPLLPKRYVDRTLEKTDRAHRR